MPPRGCRSKRRALELVPAYWEQTLEKEDTQQRLAANVFRQASLGARASSSRIRRLRVGRLLVADLRVALGVGEELLS